LKCDHAWVITSPVPKELHDPGEEQKYLVVCDRCFEVGYVVKDGPAYKRVNAETLERLK
jgi:hypothetical protein